MCRKQMIKESHQRSSEVISAENTVECDIPLAQCPGCPHYLIPVQNNGRQDDDVALTLKHPPVCSPPALWVRTPSGTVAPD